MRQTSATYDNLASQISSMPPAMSDYVANDSQLKTRRGYPPISLAYAK